MACSSSSTPLLLLCLLLLTLISSGSVLAISTSDCKIKPGSSLLASSKNNDAPWVSPSGEFAFGFQRLEPPYEGDLFLLAIWFAKIPSKTVVWSANNFPAKEGSKVTLTNKGELELSDPQGNLMKKFGNGTGDSSTCAAMLDAGNFKIWGENSSPLWESFSEPTDTILPGQVLRHVLGEDGKLVARESEKNYSDGRFQLRMQGDGNLVLYSVSMPTEVIYGAYWASGTNHPNSSSELVFDDAGLIYVKEGTQRLYNLTTKNMGSNEEYYHLARIDSDGIFRQYNYPRKGDSTGDACPSPWSVVQGYPEDICTAITSELGSGACGFNSYCANINGMPKCLCPEGYSLVDLNGTQKGCKPDFRPPSCQPGGWEMNPDLVEFKELKGTNWPLADYDLQMGEEVDKDMCRQFCLQDCFCAVVVYNGNDRCYKKKLPLSNGRKNSNENGTVVLLKVPKGNITGFQICSKKDQSTLILIISVFLGSSVFINFLLLLFIFLAVLFSYHKRLQNIHANSSFPMNVIRYSYKELEQATSGFNEKQELGRGAFGTVYKGVLPSDPKRFVAVKRLDKVVQEGEKEFETEVSVIGQTHHKNLVNLVGYCDEEDHRLLVYEYMRNGSLASFLFGISRPNWNQRAQIALGIARGLMYLHEECSTQIIHCDIKPQNILLDDYFVPRISDFGLAKLLLAEQTRAARTGLRGTIGYFAPEWFRKGSISVKVDVYSFGVMLLEIICCTSSVKFAMGDQEEAMVDWAYDCYCERKLESLVENDEEATNDMKRVERLVMVAIWCIQEDPSLRPSMRKITQMLEGVVEVSVPPSPSLFISVS